MKKPFVFISYSKRETDIAVCVHNYLERKGIVCWMAAKDIEGGLSYSVQMVDAMTHCAAVVVLASSSSNVATHIKDELEIAVDDKKKMICLKLEDYALTEQNELYLKDAKWIDASKDMDGALKALRADLKKIIKEAKKLHL